MNSKTSNQEFLKVYIDIIEELRENGRIFSQQNPDLAPYLDLSFRRSNDPETERLIESFAYMFAQVEHKSYLAQNDYILNFIEHIFPELILPITALIVLKIKPDKSFFNKNKISFNIPKFTKFSARNKDNLECQFVSTQEMPITCLNITNSSFVDSSINKEDIFKNKKAIVVNFETNFPLSISKKMNESLSVYIDSDFYSAVSIYDAIFSNKNPMIIIADDNSQPIFLSRENLVPIYNFESEDKKNNLLYPLFDFLNYHQKYFFLKLKLNVNFDVTKKFKIIIPVADQIDNISRIGNDFLQLNCIPIKNYFEKQIEPIKCSSEKYEYSIKVDGSINGDVELLSLKSVKTYNPLTGEAFNLPAFHKEKKEFYVKKENFYKKFFWATRRSFYDETKENGTVHLKLLLNEKYEIDESMWPEYLFASANCTNGINAEYLKPYSDFYCYSSDLAIEKSQSLFWPKYQGKPLKILANNDVLKFLYIVNQDLISKRLFNENEFEKLLEYLTHKGNPIKNLLNQILSNSIGFQSEETINYRTWQNQSYNLPGIEYKILFNQKNGFPHGISFLVNFLNGYFNYIKEFNLIISFEAVLV